MVRADKVAVAAEAIRALHPPDSLETIEPGAFTVACSGDEPTDYVENGHLMGIHGEVRRRVAEVLGLEVRTVAMPFPEMFDATAAGKIDTPGLGTIWTPERSRIFQFTQPFQYFTLGVAQRRCPPTVSLPSIAARRITALAGSANNVELARLAAEGGGSFEELPDLDSVLDALAAGTIDVAVYDRPNIERGLSARPELAGISVGTVEFDSRYPGTTARMPCRLLLRGEAHSLTAAASLAIELLRWSGELVRLYDSYGCSGEELASMSS